jgi:hypothetical protein
MDEEHDYTYSSPEVNYCRVIETIRELEGEFRITEDWVEEHKGHIFKYREVFEDFTKVNEEVENEEFRQKAYEAELLIRNIIHEINVNGTINLKFYLILNKHLKYMCESVWSEEELSNMIKEMGL